MNKPFNPFNSLWKNKIAQFNFFPNSRKTSSQIGENAGSQLHLVERNIIHTTNLVLNNILKLDSNSTNTNNESDLSQSYDS